MMLPTPKLLTVCDQRRVRQARSNTECSACRSRGPGNRGTSPPFGIADVARALAVDQIAAELLVDLAVGHAEAGGEHRAEVPQERRVVGAVALDRILLLLGEVGVGPVRLERRVIGIVDDVGVGREVADRRQPRRAAVGVGEGIAVRAGAGAGRRAVVAARRRRRRRDAGAGQVQAVFDVGRRRGRSPRSPAHKRRRAWRGTGRRRHRPCSTGCCSLRTCSFGTASASRHRWR